MGATEEGADSSPLRSGRASHESTGASGAIAFGLKPSTRAGYENRIGVLLVPRFGATPLAKIDGNAFTKLDVELVADELAPSTRAKIQTVLRSVLRASVRAGMLKAATTQRSHSEPPQT